MIRGVVVVFGILVMVGIIVFGGILLWKGLDRLFGFTFQGRALKAQRTAPKEDQKPPLEG